MDVLYLDKKKNGRKINFVLLEDLEKPVISSNVSEEDIRSILDVTITKV
jgi:3-dehydroquinate synthetase